MKVPELGIGLTYHPILDRVLEKHTGLIQVLEIEPQTHWLQPNLFENTYVIDEVVLQKLQQLPFHKLMHGIGFPVGGSRLPDAIEYPLHRTMIEALNVPWMSEHLNFNKACCNGREFVTNYMLPPLQTSAGVQAAVQTIKSMQSSVPVPIAVETGVNYLRTIPGQINDGRFMREVVEKADCGILLDLHNILTNQINGRQSMEDFLGEIPLERVVELHVAGGKMRGNFYIDAHCGPIPDNLFEVAAQLIPTLPNLGAVIFEIFPDYLEGNGAGFVAKDLEQLNRIWDRRKQKRGELKKRVLPPAQPVEMTPMSTITPAEWEDTLAALVTGQQVDCPWDELNDDPAIDLIKDLIQTFRASMVSESYRYTARLLMIYLGVEEYENLLANYWMGSTPEPFASTEGANFISYIQRSKIEVVGLQEIIAFEKAYMATLMDGKERVVNFPFDPLSFMKALAEGRKPHQLYEGNYELVVEARQGIIENTFHHKAVVH